MDFPFVLELLEYWADFPPVHLLLRAFVGFEGSTKAMSRKEQFADDVVKALPSGNTGARHLDCAPPHIQQAIERVKKKQHLEVPQSGVTNG